MSVTEQLCDLIDLLRKQHRAGITPSFGQVDELFELSDRLRIQGFIERHDPRRRCCVADCATPDFRVELFDANGLPYCGLHLASLRASIAQVDRLWPNGGPTAAVRTSWPVRPPVGGTNLRAGVGPDTVSGPDPRD